MGEDKKHVEYGKTYFTKSVESFKKKENQTGVNKNKIANIVKFCVVILVSVFGIKFFWGFVGGTDSEKYEYKDTNSFEIISEFTRNQYATDEKYKQIEYFNITDALVISPTKKNQNGLYVMVISDTATYNTYNLNEVLRAQHDILVLADSKKGEKILKRVGGVTGSRIHNLKVRYEKSMEGCPVFVVMGNQK